VGGDSLVALHFDRYHPSLFFVEDGHFDAKDTALVECCDLAGIDIDGENDGAIEVAPETFLGEVAFRLFILIHAAVPADGEDVIGDGDADLFDGYASDRREDHEFIAGSKNIYRDRGRSV